jgi:hypothetical protein
MRWLVLTLDSPSMLGFVAFGIFEFLDEALWTPPMKNVPVLKIHFKFEFVWLHAIAHS